jgi:hypothetical protein
MAKILVLVLAKDVFMDTYLELVSELENFEFFLRKF